MHHPRIRLGRMENPIRGLLHGSAAVLSLAGAVALLARAASWSGRIALLVFSVGLVGLYTASSLYHSVPWAEEWKKRMQRLDHSMIYVLVAGTFTPLLVIVLDGWYSWVLLAALWSIAAVGIAQQVLFPREENWLSITLQTVMGWLGLLVVVPIGRRIGIAPVLLIGIGGALYTVGMVMLVTNRPRLWPRVFSYHEAFHVLVVVASFTHWFATWRWVAPYTA